MSVLLQTGGITDLNIYLSVWLLCIPAGAFLLLMLLGRTVRKFRGIFATVAMLICFLIAVVIFMQTWGGQVHFGRVEWFRLTYHRIFYAGIYIDSIAALLLVIVTFISFLVHLFSIEYIRGNRDFEKYFAYLSLFTFSMLGIVLADNLLFLFVFWELVGLSSYLLIGFYYQKPSAIYANKKAFIVNRIGDAGFLLGILILYAHFETFNINQLSQAFITPDFYDVFSISETWVIIGGIGLFLGAVSKSAQFPLQVWLPNAMEGPTPVSALIHAATMVAAGVYLLARVFVFLHVDVLTIVAIIGAITTLMGAVAAMKQTDMKRVLAFSTVSQLGYMVMGMGVEAYDAALFHLTTHAFFKACLFLSAGAVIHSMQDIQHKLEEEGRKISFDTQDMRNMGGLRSRMPVTFIAYLVSSLALAGLPFFSGYLSKDAVLSGAFGWADFHDGGWYYLIPLIGFFTSFLTAFYMGRQVLMVFFGQFRLEKYLGISGLFTKVIETPLLMRIPIVLLALLSLGIVFAVNPFDSSSSWFMNVIFTPPSAIVTGFDTTTQWHTQLTGMVEDRHVVSSILSSILVLCGGGLAVFCFKNINETQLRDDQYNSGFTGLSYNNWYLDTIYDKTIVAGTVRIAACSWWLDKMIINRIVDGVAVVYVVLANVLRAIDRYVVDGLIVFVSRMSVLALSRIAKAVDYSLVDGFVLLAVRTTRGAGALLRVRQGGKIQLYIFAAVVGLILLLLWFTYFI